MILIWILNIMGIFIYFLNRYSERNNKQIYFNFCYWVKDNWPEVVSIIMFDLALMLILLHPETSVDLDEWLNGFLPFKIKVAAKYATSFLLGLGISSLFYEGYKKFKKKK